MALHGNLQFSVERAVHGGPTVVGFVAEVQLLHCGEQTLASYKVDDPLVFRPDLWRAAVPASHQRWINGLDLMHREGNYLFVHAGLRPGLSIKSQRSDDLMWIREPFLSDRGRDDVVVVHGHTPSPAPQVMNNRIGIDTGAVMGGVLSCLVLEAAQYRFLTA